MLGRRPLACGHGRAATRPRSAEPRPPGRAYSVATVLGSGVAGIDATVVNVALPAIGRDLEADFARPAVDGHRLHAHARRAHPARRCRSATASAGAGCSSSAWSGSPPRRCCAAWRRTCGRWSRRGRCRASAARCSTPGSLALIQASFAARTAAGRSARGRGWAGSPPRSDRSSAAGWSRSPRGAGCSSSTCRWRAVVVWLTLRHVPETRDPSAAGRVDVVGAALGAARAGRPHVRADRARGRRRGPAAAVAPAVGGLRPRRVRRRRASGARARCCRWASSRRGSSAPPTLVTFWSTRRCRRRCSSCWSSTCRSSPVSARRGRGSAAADHA